MGQVDKSQGLLNAHEGRRRKSVSAGIMGCVHSKSVGGLKKSGPDVDPGGTPSEAEPEVHPEILQLAKVG